MSSRGIHKTVITSLFVALITIATIVIRVPTLTGGYLHLGDGLVLFGALLLGPLAGAIAAGLGSMLADLLAGIPAYIPGTLVVKALTACVASIVFAGMTKRRSASTACVILSGACGEIVMVSGYLVYSALCLGFGGFPN